MALWTYWASLGLTWPKNPGGEGWNPADGVPFCARAYIGGWVKIVNFDPGCCKVRFGRQSLGARFPVLAHGCGPGTYNTFFLLLQKHSVYSAAPRGPRPPSGGKSSCFRRARGEKVFFGLLSASSERRCCSEQTSCSGCRDRLVAATEMRRDHEPRQVRQVVGRIGTRLSAAHFVLADRSYQTLEAKIRLRQAAGLFRSPLLFLAQGAPKQSPRTNQRR